MFQQVHEPLFELESLLDQNPGLVVAGNMAIMQHLQKLLIFMESIGMKEDMAEITAESGEYLKHIRMALLSLEKSVGVVDDPSIKCATLDQASLQKLIRGVKAVLAGLKMHMDSLENSVAPGVGSREQLARDLEKREGKETTTIQFSFDGLDTINKREGREAGDAVLQRIASMLKDTCGEQYDVYQDGPGFVVVGDQQEESDVKQLSSNVTASISQDERGNALKVVIGVVLNEVENVLDKTHMATASSDGPPTFFTPNLEEEKSKALEEHKLALSILEKKNFHPEYQEIFSRGGIFSKQQRKFEALWRCQDMSPIRFFQAMKSENRINEVTTQMLPMIFKDVQGKDVEVAINMTPEELGMAFGGVTFPHFVKQQCIRFKARPSNVIIELVEWSDEDHISDEGIVALRNLKKLGCKLALDDYGVRNSNLVRLMQLCENGVMPDFIKIDAALVKGLNRYLQDSARHARCKYSIIGIRSIVQLVEELRRETKAKIGIVAEFVDNQKLLKMLEKLGVTHFQGFYLGKPKKAAESF